MLATTHDCDELEAENLDPTHVGHTWQCFCICFITMLNALLGYARMVLQGENIESCLWWMDPVTVAVERCSLPEGLAVEEPRCPCGLMRWLLWIYSWL